MTAQTLALTPDALEIIDEARKEGVSVVAEIYMYTYGGTIVGADYLKPDNYQTNMGRDYKDIIEVATLKPLTKERYEELLKSNPGTSVLFYNRDRRGSDDRVGSSDRHHRQRCFSDDGRGHRQVRL